LSQYVYINNEWKNIFIRFKLPIYKSIWFTKNDIIIKEKGFDFVILVKWLRQSEIEVRVKGDINTCVSGMSL
jgi:hypothetical protein